MSRPPRSLEVSGLAHNAPIPLGARVGNLICSSGIAGKDPATGQLPPDAASQARARLRQHAAPARGRWRHASPTWPSSPSTRKDNSVRDAINAEWLRSFPDPADRPARHILLQDLQHGMWLQLEFIALIQKAG